MPRFFERVPRRIAVPLGYGTGMWLSPLVCHDVGKVEFEIPVAKLPNVVQSCRHGLELRRMCRGHPTTTAADTLIENSEISDVIHRDDIPVC